MTWMSYSSRGVLVVNIMSIYLSAYPLRCLAGKVMWRNGRGSDRSHNTKFTVTLTRWGLWANVTKRYIGVRWGGFSGPTLLRQYPIDSCNC